MTTKTSLSDREPKAYPEGWPELHNACNEPCDMLRGPCVCGAWHEGDDQAAKAITILEAERGRLATKLNEIASMPKHISSEVEQILLR